PQLLSNNTAIIPQHVWSKISNPETFVNANPVGTGPFARIAKFSSQEYILGKNKYYWQKLSYDGIRVPALTDNTSTLAAAIKGDLEPTACSIDMVQTTSVSPDPHPFRADYKAFAYPLCLYFTAEQYPSSLYSLREAISLARDRQTIHTFAEN